MTGEQFSQLLREMKKLRETMIADAAARTIKEAEMKAAVDQCAKLVFGSAERVIDLGKRVAALEAKVAASDRNGVDVVPFQDGMR